MDNDQVKNIFYKHVRFYENKLFLFREIVIKK